MLRQEVQKHDSIPESSASKLLAAVNIKATIFRNQSDAISL